MKAALAWKLNPNDPCTMPVRKNGSCRTNHGLERPAKRQSKTLYQILCLRIRSREEIATIGSRSFIKRRRVSGFDELRENRKINRPKAREFLDNFLGQKPAMRGGVDYFARRALPDFGINRKQVGVDEVFA